MAHLTPADFYLRLMYETEMKSLSKSPLRDIRHEGISDVIAVARIRRDIFLNVKSNGEIIHDGKAMG